MKIAVLSGKGGTGKTFVSVNIASLLKNSIYLDCDVEEPNGSFYFEKHYQNIEKVYTKIPHFEFNKCIGCSKCVNFCKFNALAMVNKKPMLFKDVCHSCGGCAIVCEENAISEINKEIGTICTEKANDSIIISGNLNIGESSGVPLIKEIFKKTKEFQSDHQIIDCPPGSGCLVDECIKNCDYCLLVAEPTIFGLHNLKMVIELVKLNEKPFFVVLNKCLDTYNPTKEFCLKNGIKIVGSILYTKEINQLNGDGKVVSSFDVPTKNIFKSLIKEINLGDEL